MPTDPRAHRPAVESSRSGDRYGMLPKSLRVTLRLSDSAFAIPKSSTLISPDVREPHVARFEIAMDERPRTRGRRSSVLKRCAASRKRHSSRSDPVASAALTGPRAMTSDRFSPSTYSIAMK